jgi:hypothetical protein
MSSKQTHWSEVEVTFGCKSWFTWKAHLFDSWDLMASIMNEAAKERDLLFPEIYFLHAEER